MKAKKMISMIMAVVMLFAASVMMFTVNAKLTYYYNCAFNNNATIHSMASIQANPNSARTVFLDMLATHRVDAYGTSNASVGNSVRLNIVVNATKQFDVSETFSQSGTVTVGNSAAYINCEADFDAAEFVTRLTGSYEVYDLTTGERWVTPTIVWEPDGGEIVNCSHVGNF